MKRIVSSLMLLILLMGCAAIHPPGEIQQTTAPEISKKETTIEVLQANLDQENVILPNSVGVLPFQEKGEETGLGLAASEFFSANLGLVDDLNLIDLSTTSVLDAEFATFSPDKKQKALHAEQIVTGYVTQSGGKLFINGLLRSAETTDYEPLAVLDGEQSDFFRLVADLDIRFLEKRGVTVTQEMADQFYTVPTEKIEAYILYAKGRQAEYLGNFDEAKAAYQEASEIDPDFEEAKESNQRVEQQMTASTDVVTAPQPQTQSTSEDLFASPIEQPPSIEEKNVPATGNTGTVTIRMDLP
ncbi:tetratricopeptide repeat protein [candidate division KSB1 bacterium]|nr:tetratricopeptide repeat protein [candidate division KSB1 bacterium]